MATYNEAREELMESAATFAQACIRKDYTLIQVFMKSDQDWKQEDSKVRKLAEVAMFVTYAQAGLA